MERVIPINVEGQRKYQHPEQGELQLDEQTQIEDQQQFGHCAKQRESPRHSPRLDFGNASYREYVWEGGDSGEEKEGSKRKKETAKFGRRWRESGEKREGVNFTATTSVDASTNVVFESSSRTVKRSKKTAADATRGPKEVEDLLKQSAEEARGPRSSLDNTSYHEFVWEGGDNNGGAAVTLINMPLSCD